MKRTLLLLGLVVLVSACGTAPTKRPANDSNYETDFRYPELTEHYVLQQKVIFPEPEFGAMLRYTDKRMYGDLITVYVYPVPGISWDNPDETLNHEMSNVLAEIDHAIKMGVYSARSEAALSDFAFVHEDQAFAGKKARMQLIHQSKQVLDSDVYLFLAEDKLIKFRTSFDASFTPDWTGDGIVKEILPGITPPPESEYMRELRAEYVNKMAAEVMRALLDASKKDR